MKKDYINKAKQIIKENIYCVLSTATLAGKPWISPIFYGYDENFNIYWVSNKNARHSQLVRANPQAAIVIFNSQAPEGQGDGVYFETAVKELVDENNIKQAIQIMNKRVKKEAFKVRRMEDVSGEGMWRIYQAIPKTISKLTEGEYVNGQYIDKRVNIQLR